MSFSADSTATLTMQAPANQYIMVGNPSVTRPATVSGADTVFVYDATAGQYNATNTIPPGGGAWALRSTAGTITIAP